MKFIIKLLIVCILLAVAGGVYWTRQPIIASSAQPIEFEIKSGSSVRSGTRQIAAAGAPLNPILFEALFRVAGRGANIKAGYYLLKPGATPTDLLAQLMRGEFEQVSLAVIDGWTFRQMRQVVDASAGLRHDTAQMTDAELLGKITPDYTNPEGLFFPDTYVFAKGTSDLQLYKRAYAALQLRLNEGWEHRAASLPYRSPYEALIMASIVEKETGRPEERSMVAAVFVNRLKLGMLLQTDPTVIYGMGGRYQGQIHKRDLQADTPYNTYVRAGLPPTPICLPGGASIAAALGPAETDALYFVSRGDGTSQFSSRLDDHNRAVAQYQLQRR